MEVALTAATKRLWANRSTEPELPQRDKPTRYEVHLERRRALKDLAKHKKRKP